MRFMVQVRATKSSEAGEMPSAQMLQEMGAFNQSLIDSGAMLAGDGLWGSDKGKRITWTAGKPAVTDGPFPVSEVVSGYWIVQMDSLEQVVEVFSKCPPTGGDNNGTIEIRKCFEEADFANLT